MTKKEINKEFYKTNEILEAHSNYALFPNEKYLIQKYFSPETSVLDLACGTGRTTVPLYERGYKVKGVDLSDVLINAAKKRFPYISFEQGSYTDIQEKDDSYDNILISHNGIDYAFPEEEREMAIKNCARILKRGGYLLLSSHNLKSLYFSPFYFRRHKKWFLKNMIYGFNNKKYIYVSGLWTFFASPEYFIAQIEKYGFTFKEMVGFRKSFGKTANKYFSPFIHYVFQKK
jgi:ubiquinone/menaquinone biosynthesis C-methylase UbiE